jgi:hypothetical protein
MFDTDVDYESLFRIEGGWARCRTLAGAGQANEAVV